MGGAIMPPTAHSIGTAAAFGLASEPVVSSCFEAHGQEEDGKQTILGPVANRQVEIGVGDEQMRFRYGLERMRGGGQVREHQAGEREAEHDESGNTV